MLNRVFHFVNFLVFLGGQAFAQTPMNFVPPLNREGNEYFVGKHEGKPLIKVHLLSGVRMPGVYHIPVQTSLAEFLAYAGGAEDEVDLEKVTIRSTRGDSFEVHTYNLKDLMSNSLNLPGVREGDLITLPNSQSKLTKVQVWVTIASTVMSGLLAASLLHQNQK